MSILSSDSSPKLIEVSTDCNNFVLYLYQVHVACDGRRLTVEVHEMHDVIIVHLCQDLQLQYPVLAMRTRSESEATR